VSEIRRIIRIGERSVGVTIPKEWLDRLNIDVGDNVKVSTYGRSIVITPIKEVTTAEEVAEVSSSDPEHLFRIAIALYTEGVDEIVLSGVPAAFLLPKLESRLPGIVALESDGKFRVRIITKEVVDVHEIVRSMATLVDAMFQLMSKYFDSGDRTHLEELLRIDDQLDRLHFLSVRSIKKLVHSDPKLAIDQTLVVKNIEHIGDSLDRIAGALLRGEAGDDCLPRLKRMANMLRDYSLSAINAYLSADQKVALDVLVRRVSTFEEVFRSLSECKNSSVFVHEFALIIGLASDIAESAYSRYARTSLIVKRGEG